MKGNNMNKSIAYFLASGTLGVGGVAAGAYYFRLGLLEASLQLQLREAKTVAQLVQAKIDLADLHKRAQALGIDPEKVALSLREVRSSFVKSLGRAQ